MNFNFHPIKKKKKKILTFVIHAVSIIEWLYFYFLF